MRRDFYPSKDKALERISALLVSDRAELPAELLEILKAQIVGTLVEYADIDSANIRMCCDNRRKSEIEVAVPFIGYKKVVR